MQTLGAFQVKTHLSQLLNEVEQNGETIAITRHGLIIALLSPYPTPNLAVAAVEAIRKHRKGVTLGRSLSLKTLIAEGRR